jgi:nucleotide-binding universal stress UspA family protein
VTGDIAADPNAQKPEAVLVAVDFSPCSLRALRLALEWLPEGREVVVLHVVDVELAQRMERAGAGTQEAAIGKMRTFAETELARLVAELGRGKFETMVAEGLPFAQICKIATDLDCDLIVMGKYGSAPEVKDLLFGGTAEKVVRAARQPVLCVP